jgi:uncharacterized protein (TIRG00374 family)
MRSVTGILRKYLKFIVLFLVMVVILYFFGRNLDWAEVRAGLARANKFYLALAFIGICFGYFIRAVRWQVLLKPISDSRLLDLFATTTVGFAAILIVGRAGEIVRPMWLPMRDHRVRPSAAFVTIVLERILDLASVMAFFSISLIWFRIPPEHADQFSYIKSAGNVLSGLILAGIVGLVVYHRYSKPIIGFFARLTDRKFVPRRLRYLFLSILEKLAFSLDILKSPLGVFLDDRVVGLDRNTDLADIAGFWPYFRGRYADDVPRLDFCYGCGNACRAYTDACGRRRSVSLGNRIQPYSAWCR